MSYDAVVKHLVTAPLLSLRTFLLPSFGACVVAVCVVRALAEPLPYVAAVAWAFVGVVVNAVMADALGLRPLPSPA